MSEVALLENPFLVIDFLSPVYEQKFDTDLLKDVDVPTDEYSDKVFVFDVKELRIKYFHSVDTKIKEGKKTNVVDTTIIVFSDNTELLTRATVKELFEDFINDYLTKLNKYFKEETEFELRRNELHDTQ
mgnify:FL=1